ncbi:MAG: hypothetical protein KIT62_17470 [Cyclobacteriaceae bacterium]|nr:hypothetical protein [Cyclobacteriaceae bacterium]
MKTRDAFHQLIDKIEDEALLNSYFELIKVLNKNQTGILWDSLKKEEKEELLLSYVESFQPENLIDHDQVKAQHAKWLKK